MNQPVAILALQGDFACHGAMLDQIGAPYRYVRKPEELKGCAGLILPGGESTSLTRQIDFIGLRQPLQDFAVHHPLLGTCAGLILMAENVEGGTITPLSLLSITVQRNAYGRQIASLQTTLSLRPPASGTLRAAFIRAPLICDASNPNISVLATYEDHPVIVMQRVGNVTHLGAACHPEVCGDSSLHRFFLDLLP